MVRIGRLSALACLLWLGSGSAQASSFASVVCLTTMQTTFGLATCSQYQPVGSAGVAATGEASANLATGALKSRSIGQAYQSGAEDWNAIGSSIAEFQDTITIGGGFSGTVQVVMEVSGSFLMSDPSFPSGAPQLATLLTLWNPAGEVSEVGVFVKQYNTPFQVYLTGLSTRGTGGLSSNANFPGGNGASFSDPADVHLVLTTSIAVTPSSSTFTLHARIGTSAAVSGLVDTNGQIKTSELDFGHTAQLSLILPAGVPWTSESGVFLQSIPEPEARALLAAGVLWLAAIRRPRRPAAN